MDGAEDPRRIDYPKIELHVHLEGTVGPQTLLDLAARNGVTLPVDTIDGVRELYEFTDFAHFVEVWILTTNVMRTADDFRQIVVDYAEQARRHGAIYLEAIFSPIERVARGVSWEDIFEGYCDGAQLAQERHGVVIRLTPDAYRGADVEHVEELARRCVAYRDRGVVGLGLGGAETATPPDLYAKAFAIAKDGGLASVPHAGESAGADSVRATLDVLHADRIRHGIRALDDVALTAELRDRRIVLDVCPTSNLRTRSVETLDAHPLKGLVDAGVLCTVNTDDPAMFGTDLGAEHQVARALGVTPTMMFDAGLAGATCDDATLAALQAVGAGFDWTTT